MRSSLSLLLVSLALLCALLRVSAEGAAAGQQQPGATADAVAAAAAADIAGGIPQMLKNIGVHKAAEAAAAKASKPSAPSFVRELTDENFEHDTQASTGATTGDWFVEFFAPWCGHCKSLTPVWAELSVYARENQLPVSIAALDATIHTRTAQRFNVRAFPTLKLISRGRVYDYTGARTAEALKRYIEDKEWLRPAAPKDGSAAALPSTEPLGSPVPEEVGMLTLWVAAVREAASDVAMLAYRKTGAAVTLAGVGFLLGVLGSMLVFILFLEPAPIVYQMGPAAAAGGAASATPAAVVPPTNVAAKKAE